MTGVVNTSQLLGLDALGSALRETWQAVQGVLAEHGPNAVLAGGLVLVYALVFAGAGRLGAALVRRLVSPEAQAVTARIVRTILRLTFLGTSAFNLANDNGRLRYFQQNGNTIIQGSTDDDIAPEFEIELTGLHTLTANDFVL